MSRTFKIDSWYLKSCFRGFERNTGEEIKAVFVDYLLGFLMFSMEVFLQ